jgi:hypothetical protein
MDYGVNLIIVSPSPYRYPTKSNWLFRLGSNGRLTIPIGGSCAQPPPLYQSQKRTTATVWKPPYFIINNFCLHLL